MAVGGNVVIGTFKVFPGDFWATLPFPSDNLRCLVNI